MNEKTLKAPFVLMETATSNEFTFIKNINTFFPPIKRSKQSSFFFDKLVFIKNRK